MGAGAGRFVGAQKGRNGGVPRDEGVRPTKSHKGHSIIRKVNILPIESELIPPDPPEEPR
jgi:hypothetical protein